MSIQCLKQYVFRPSVF